MRKTSFLREKGIPAGVLPFILACKVAGGFLIARYYLQTYKGGDIHGYLADTATLHEFFWSHPLDFFKLIFGIYDESPEALGIIDKLKIWHDSGYSAVYNDARTVIRFHALLSIFSGGSEWVHLLWSNVLALTGTVALLRFFFRGRDETVEIPRYAYLIFFLPNVFIWSSAILKEPLLLFSMGMTLRYFQLWNYQRTWKYFGLLILFTFCFLLIKSFWLIAFLPGFFIWMMAPDMKNPFLKIAASYALLLTVVLMIGPYFSAINIPALLYGQQLNMWRFAVFMKSGSLVHPVAFAPSAISFLKHIPDAFAFALFQPWPSQLIKWYHFPLFLENLFVPVLFFRALYFALKVKPGLSVEVILACLVGSIIVVVCGFTTPVIGSLIRYRMPGLILLMLALLSVQSDTKSRIKRT